MAGVHLRLCERSTVVEWFASKGGLSGTLGRWEGRGGGERERRKERERGREREGKDVEKERGRDHDVIIINYPWNVADHCALVVMVTTQK